MLKTLRTFDAVLLILYYFQVNWRKTYSSVTRAKIQHILKTIYDIDVSLKAISYHLTIAYLLGLLNGWPRSARRPDGTLYNLASNRSFTGKGLLYLKKLGKSIALYLWNWAFKGIKPPRVKKPQASTFNYNIVPRLPRGSAAGFTALSEALSGALKTIT